jgi:hypothetical protein
MTTFSFTNNPVLQVLKNAHSILPGIEKVIGVYYCPESSEIKSKSAHYNTSGNDSLLEDIDFTDEDGLIQNIRKSNSYFYWLRKEETPFEPKQTQKAVQMNVFQEMENVILVLGYYNEHDQKNDLLFFFFNQDQSNFGVSDSNKVLTSESKKIIGFLLYNSVKTMIETFRNDNIALNLYNENTKSIIRRYSQSREDLEKTKNNYGLSLVDLCKSYVKECSENNSRFNYILSDDSLDKIKSYQGDITALKVVITKAINYVNNLYHDSSATDIYITVDYLNFETVGAGMATKPQEVQLYDRYSKTILLLDKLENAARDVVARNMDLTSANVGNACSTPISAPAISDAVKKHKNKIIHLLNKYPDRWRLMRTDFRPVRNIISSRPDLMEKSA